MSHNPFARRVVIAALAAGAVTGLAASPGIAAPTTAGRTSTSAPTSASASDWPEPAWDIPDIAPKGKQLAGNVTLFADFGNYPWIAPTGEHWCQEPGRTGMETIAGRTWMFVEDYTTDAESLYKNDADINISGWSDGKQAFNRSVADKLKCNWYNPQTRLTWTGKNPQRYWLSTSGKVGTKYAVTGAVRVGDMIVAVTGRSTKAATARAMAVRMTLAVERNLRATDLVRHD